MLTRARSTGTALALASALLLTLPGLAASAGTHHPHSTWSPFQATQHHVNTARRHASPALPACGYKDQMTRFRSPRDWKKTLVDTNLKVGPSYKPRDLVSVSSAGLKGIGSVRKVMQRDLRAMTRAAKRAGKAIAARSAYRSYGYQVGTFNGWVNRVGKKQALRASARPGHSEHQLGLVVDFQSANSSRAPWDYADWAKTPAGSWMKSNAWKYGFILSYPKGKEHEVCYKYESWHYRYVGKDQARKIHRSGQTLRRYLWDTYESKGR